MTLRIDSKSFVDVSGFSKRCDRSLAFSPSECTVLTDRIRLSRKPVSASGTLMTEVYAGKCVGGPHDGRKLAHYSQRKEVVFLDYDAMALNLECTGGIGEEVNTSSAFYVFEDGVWKWQAKN